MKKIIIKIDRAILDFLTLHVRRWIAKHDYEKHKIDLKIKVQKLKFAALVLLCFLIPALVNIIEGKYLSAGFHLLIWSLSVGINYYTMQMTTNSIKPLHDWFFAQRKNPVVYEMEKHILEEVFVRGRRSRIVMLLFDFLICWFFGVGLLVLYAITPTSTVTIGIFFLAYPFLSEMEIYLPLVFDFDEPEQKKKKESLTKVVLEEWKRIVEGLLPEPNFGT